MKNIRFAWLRNFPLTEDVRPGQEERCQLNLFPEKIRCQLHIRTMSSGIVTYPNKRCESLFMMMGWTWSCSMMICAPAGDGEQIFPYSTDLNVKPLYENISEIVPVSRI